MMMAPRIAVATSLAHLTPSPTCLDVRHIPHLDTLCSPVKVTNSDESLESSSLTGRSLLLDRLDSHDLVLQSRKENVDDLVLFDRKREEVDFLHRLYFSVLDQSTEFGNGDPKTSTTTPRSCKEVGAPFLLLVLLSTSSGSSSTSGRTSSSTESTSATSSSSSFSHFECLE